MDIHKQPMLMRPLRPVKWPGQSSQSGSQITEASQVSGTSFITSSSFRFSGDRRTNRGNDLLIQLLQHRYPEVVGPDEEQLIREYLSFDERGQSKEPCLRFFIWGLILGSGLGLNVGRSLGTGDEGLGPLGLLDCLCSSFQLTSSRLFNLFKG